MEPALYSIGVVARMIGVPVSTLRTWEERYGLVIGIRSSGGQRRYTRTQLAQLSFVVDQLEKRFSPGDAHRLLAEQIDQGGDLVDPSAEADEPGVLILIAERDPVAASLEDYLLRTEGFRVEIAASAEEAERLFDELSPQIVIVELLLSGGVGGRLIERLKGAGATVIAVSPLAAPEVAAEFGAAAFVQKPIDPLVLVSTVRDLLGDERARQTAIDAALIERLSSGNERLDRILGGGLPGNAIHLVAGPPGSGKTILAEQYAFSNATAERPAVYLSTVSEPLDKLVRFGQTLDFFDVAAIGRRVFYEDLGDHLEREGLEGVLERLRALLRERHPGILIIDSFKALAAYADSHRAFRSFLYQLAADTGAVAGSSFWLGEYDLDRITGEPEFAVADSILGLGSHRTAERSSRVLEVLKLRGSGYLSGQHSYRIGAAGLSVFPRLADAIDSSSYDLGAERLSTGIDALDEMLTDGYWPGSSTLCAGPSGIGKTLMGLHFVVAGARVGERGIIASLQENPTQLTRVARAFGWALDDSVTMMYRSPVDLYVDEWIYELLDAVDRRGAKRVLIDSLTDILFASGDEIRFREYMYSLIQRCSRSGVSLFMTSELPDLFAVTRLSEFGVSHLSDNVLVLQYLRDETAFRRAITALKTRASRNDPRVREFTIGPRGIVLSDAA